MVIAAPPDRAESASRGRSRLVLAPGTEIEIAEEGSSRVRYRLARGMVALEVEGLGPGESIAVATGDLEAEVLGTVFAVSIEDGRTAVDVVEGIVVVSRRDSPTWRVGGGQRLVAPLDRRASVEDLPAEDRAAVIDLLALWEAPAAGASRGDGSGSGGTPEPAGEISGAPARETAIAEGGGTGDRARDASSSLAGEEPMDALRGLVANGRFIEAEGSIARHLESNPEDTVAWSLLADCRRKSFRWFDAVSAYLEVIDRSERSEADLARYKAGVILQDRLGEHRAAVRLFGEYLAGSGDGPLAPDAMSRLAKSLIALGEVERARSLLERVVAEHHDLPAADSARASLGLLDLYAEGSGPPEQHTR